MKIRLALFALLACLGILPACHAQFGPTRTVIKDSVLAPSGRAANGTLTVTASSPFRTFDGWNIGRNATRAQIKNGTFQIALAPNLGGAPFGSYYLAQYNFSDGTYAREYWVVPSEGTPIPLSSVRAEFVDPTIMIAASQVQPPSPCSIGNAVLWQGINTGWQCGSVASFGATAANLFFASPNGSSGTPAFRAIVAADLPPCGASGLSHAAGLVPDPGATAGTSRFLREDCTWVTPSGSFGNQNANLVLAGPSSGSPAAPTFRSLVVADLPSGYPYSSLAGAPTIYYQTVQNSGTALPPEPKIDMTGPGSSCTDDPANSRTLCSFNTGSGIGDPAETHSLGTISTASPAFNPTSSTAGTLDVFIGTLATNVTSPTLGTPTNGEDLTFLLTQDATGNRTFTWPSAFTGQTCPVNPLPNVTTYASYRVDAGGVPQLLACRTSETPSITRYTSERAAPSSGLAEWPDLTDHDLEFLDGTNTFAMVLKGGVLNPVTNAFTSTQGNGSKVQLSTGSTASGDCGKFDANGNIIDSGAPCGTGSGGSGGPNYGTSFSAQTSVTILGTTHNLGTKNLIVACYDNASPANSIQPANYTVNGSTFDVIVTFATAQTGYCVVNGSGPAVYSASESSATSWSIPAATHGLGTALQVRTYDSNGNQIDASNVNVDVSGNVTISWAFAQAGKVVITQ